MLRAACCHCRRKTDLENSDAGKRSRETSSPWYVIKLTWENLEGTNGWEGFPWWYRIHLQSRRPGLTPGGGNGSSLQYSPLGNPMDRVVWRAAIHGVAKSQTGLSDQTTEGRSWQPTRPTYIPGTLALETILTKRCRDHR